MRLLSAETLEGQTASMAAFVYVGPNLEHKLN